MQRCTDALCSALRPSASLPTCHAALHGDRMGKIVSIAGMAGGKNTSEQRSLLLLRPVTLCSSVLPCITSVVALPLYEVPKSGSSYCSVHAVHVQLSFSCG